jgi:hypothetical protein
LQEYVDDARRPVETCAVGLGAVGRLGVAAQLDAARRAGARTDDASQGATESEDFAGRRNKFCLNESARARGARTKKLKHNMNRVLVWHRLLIFFGILNISLWTWMWMNVQVDAVQLYCSALYTFACAFRSFLPRADLQRIVIVDHYLSAVVVGRSVATIGELGYAYQVNFSARSRATVNGDD